MALLLCGAFGGFARFADPVVAFFGDVFNFEAVVAFIVTHCCCGDNRGVLKEIQFFKEGG